MPRDACGSGAKERSASGGGGGGVARRRSMYVSAAWREVGRRASMGPTQLAWRWVRLSSALME